MKKFKKYFVKKMIFPTAFALVIKLVVAAALTMLWNHFVNGEGWFDPISLVLSAVGVLYLLMGWLGFLRLDGVHMPRVFSYKRANKKKAQAGSMADVLNTEPETDDELDVDEKDFSSMASWLTSGIICLIVGIIG